MQVRFSSRCKTTHGHHANHMAKKSTTTVHSQDPESTARQKSSPRTELFQGLVGADTPYIIEGSPQYRLGSRPIALTVCLHQTTSAPSAAVKVLRYHLRTSGKQIHAQRGSVWWLLPMEVPQPACSIPSYRPGALDMATTMRSGMSRRTRS